MKKRTILRIAMFYKYDDAVWCGVVRVCAILCNIIRNVAESELQTAEVAFENRYRLK